MQTKKQKSRYWCGAVADDGEAIVVSKDAGDDAVMKIARLKTGRCVKSLVV